MSSKPRYDRADERALLDSRGYTGALIRGQNPALLLEKGVRERITESYYWKEQCFGLNAATLCDRAAELQFIGGTTGINGKPTPFLCLAFKMLQLVPERGVVLEYLNFRDGEGDGDGDGEEEEEGMKQEHGNDDNDDIADPSEKLHPEPLGAFKYLRCLAAFYIRLAWTPVEIHTTLEPLLTDHRKIRRRLKDSYTLTHVDEFVDDLLTKERMCATSLWKMPRREDLEDVGALEARESLLDGEVGELDGLESVKDGVETVNDGDGEGSYRSRSRSGSYDSRSRSQSRSRSGSYDSRDRRRTRSPSDRSRRSLRSRTRSMSRSRSRS